MDETSSFGRSSEELARRALLIAAIATIVGAGIGEVSAIKGFVAGNELVLVSSGLLFGTGSIASLLFFPGIALRTLASTSTVYFCVYLSVGSTMAVLGHNKLPGLFVYLIWFFPLLVFNKLVNSPVVGRLFAAGLRVAPLLLILLLSPWLIERFAFDELILLTSFTFSYFSYALMLETVTRYREEYIIERERAESLKSEIIATEAQAASKAKSLFLSTMSHEIRTPMNAILGYSQLMSRDPGLADEARAHLKIINRSSEHLLTMINDILDLARIESGQMEVNTSVFGLRGLLLDLEAMFRLRADAKNLQFELSVGGEPVDCIVADEGKIRQVLINLLGNAIKFTERGRIRLEASLNSRPDDRRLWLSTQVTDTGVGMTATEQSEMFQPFAQGRAGQRVCGGTGLGLAISRGLAHLMGGNITLNSAIGAGSVFCFEVPIERGNHQDLPESSVEGRRVVGLEPGQTVPRILIADDVPDSRDWLNLLLTAIGFSVRLAENGEEAVCVWRTWRPHLILMDVHMPMMDGLEAARRIKSAATAREKTIIIALTADVMSDHRRNLLDNRVDDFLSKPCREEHLLEKIRGHLGLVYVYEKRPMASELASDIEIPPVSLRAEQLAAIPSHVIRELHNATLRGDQSVMNKLICDLHDLGNEECAKGLRELSDGYQYDKLNELLEQGERLAVKHLPAQ